MNERIKELRKALGMTQQEIADRLGIKRNTYCQYEIGRNEPIDAVINLICREFHVSEAWLRTGEGEMFLRVSMEDELSEMFGRLISDDSPLAPVKRSLIHSLLRLPPESWEVLFSLAESMVEANKKEEQDP